MTLYPRSGFLRKTIYFVCLILIFVASDMIWARWRRVIHPRYDTTRVVEPTLPDGAVDYLGEIETYFSRGVTPDNNAVPLLFEALGRTALPKTQPPDGITSRLGMPHLPEQGDYFVSFGDFTKAATGKAGSLYSDGDVRIGQPPTLPEPSPAAKQWIAANEKPLAKIALAAKRTRYFIPFNGGNRPELILSVLLPHVNPMRDVTYALAERARARLESGDLSGAREDLLTLHRLARLFNQAPTLVERLVAIASERLACNTDRLIADTGKLPAQALRSYASELAALRDLDAPTAAIDVGERSMVLDATQRLARLGPVESGRLARGISDDGGLPPPWLFPFLPIPYEQSMIDANAWYDGLLTAFGQPTYAQRHDALLRWEKGIDEASSGSHLGVVSADWALRMFMPNLNRFQTRWETARAEMRLTRVALLLAAYKQEHNAYPESLDGLAPESPLPVDNFTDHPFLYSRTSSGYTLYSPGPNMIDDAGGNDDITVTAK
jgi:hypothetical protein